MSIQLFPKMKRFFFLLLAVLLMAGLLAVNAHAASSNKITDYGDAYGHWAYEALTWAVDNGVMIGTSEEKLSPDDYLTRAQMAAMIDRLFGTYKSADIFYYTDVSPESWYFDYIAQAVNMGTFTGYSGSRMGPDDNITREQAIVALARTVCLPAASGSALSRFPDQNEVSAWAADSVAAMVEYGYVSGYNDGRMNPQGQITRAERRRSCTTSSRTSLIPARLPGLTGTPFWCKGRKKAGFAKKCTFPKIHITCNYLSLCHK